MLLFVDLDQSVRSRNDDSIANEAEVDRDFSLAPALILLILCQSFFTIGDEHLRCNRVVISILLGSSGPFVRRFLNLAVTSALFKLLDVFNLMPTIDSFFQLEILDTLSIFGVLIVVLLLCDLDRLWQDDLANMDSGSDLFSIIILRDVSNLVNLITLILLVIFLVKESIFVESPALWHQPQLALVEQLAIRAAPELQQESLLVNLAFNVIVCTFRLLYGIVFRFLILTVVVVCRVISLIQIEKLLVFDFKQDRAEVLLFVVKQEVDYLVKLVKPNFLDDALMILVRLVQFLVQLVHLVLFV